MTSSRSPLSWLQAQQWFWLLTLGYISLWLLTIVAVRLHLPMDTLEAVTWSQHLDWGYDRNPYINAWFVALLVHLGQGDDWLLYLGSKFLLIACFFALWRLGRHWLNPAQTLVAIFMLVGLQYFNIAAIELNDNMLELGLWPLTALFFYDAVHSDERRSWLLFGCCAGLACMSKYYSLLLLVSLLFYLLLTRPKTLLRSGMLQACFIITLFCLPHLIWLWEHNFVTLAYTQDSMGQSQQWLDHLREPIRFASIHLLAFLLPLLLALLAVEKQSLPWQQQQKLGHRLNRDSKIFLLSISLLPLLLTCLISLISGCGLRTNWGQPLLSFWGITLLAFWQPAISLGSLKRFLTVSAVLTVLTTLAFAYSLSSAEDDSSANYPGKAIAAFVEQQWQQAGYASPLPYVVGDRRIAGSIAHYGQDKPNVYMDMQAALNAHIDEEKIRDVGAVFVWNAKKLGPETPTAMTERFPLQYLGTEKFRYHRSRAGHDFYLGLALLPPRQEKSELLQPSLLG